jgi:hypothetical protein
MSGPRDALDGDSIAFVLAAQMRGLIEALRQPDVLLSSGLDPERARAWILRCAPQPTAAATQMRRRVDQRPGSLSAAEIAALTRIAEAMKPYIDLIARFRPDPESRQAP